MSKKLFVIGLILSYSAAKGTPHFGSNALRIILEQAGYMGDPRFTKMMLLSKKFNGAAENLTRKKSPLSFLDLSSRITWSFQEWDLKQFYLIKDTILNSSRTKKCLSFKDTSQAHIKDIVDILKHTPIQEHLESLQIDNVSLDPFFKNALKNLIQLKNISLTKANFQDEEMPIPLQMTSLDLSFSRNIPHTFWDTLQKHFNLQNKDCQNKETLFSGLFKMLNLASCEVPITFWDALNDCPQLQLLNASETNFPGASCCLSSHLKVLNLSGCDNISDWKFIEKLNRLEDLNLSHTFFTGEKIKLSLTVQYLKMRNCLHITKCFLESLTKFNQLKTLDLGFLDLENTKIFFPKSLRYLDLEGCQNIRSFTLKSIKKLDQLQVLDLSFSDFKKSRLSLPQNILSLNLSFLDLENANLLLPVSLKDLYLEGCRNINCEIFDAIQHLNQLESLNLSFVDFKKHYFLLPQKIRFLNLSCCRNQSDEFENTFHRLPQLKKLKASKTDFTFHENSLPESLKELHLDGCTKISQNFFSMLSKLHQLEKLDLSDMDCSYIKEAFFPVALKYLKMNAFKCKLDFWENLQNLPLLQELHVAGTQFTGQASAITKALGPNDKKIFLFPSLKFIDIEKCEEILDDFLQNLQKSSVVIHQ